MSEVDSSPLLPPWRVAVNELARVAGLSAVVFATLYVLGLVRLFGYVSALQIPFQLVRQDPVSIASSVLLLVIPTWAIWFNWRIQDSAYRTWLQAVKRQWLAIVLAVGISVGLVVTGITRGEWSFAATYGVIALLYAFLGKPDSGLLESSRTLSLLGLALVVASAVLGYTDALTTRSKGAPSMSIRVTPEQPGLIGHAVKDSTAWDYDNLVFLYQDLDRLYVVQHPDRKVVVLVPLETVTSTSIAPP